MQNGTQTASWVDFTCTGVPAGSLVDILIMVLINNKKGGIRVKGSVLVRNFANFAGATQWTERCICDANSKIQFYDDSGTSNAVYLIGYWA
jgi:hypothetical protein